MLFGLLFQQLYNMVDTMIVGHFLGLNPLAGVGSTSVSYTHLMSIRLLKDCFADDAVNDLLVACYAIGWSITEAELE